MRVLGSNLFERGRDDPYVECRYCGTTLRSAGATCPNCGSERTVTYEVD